MISDQIEVQIFNLKTFHPKIGVILPDANKEFTISQIAGAAFGAAGQRCMAL